MKRARLPLPGEDDLVAELRRRRRVRGSSKRIAHAAGLSTTTICQVALGKRPPSDRLARSLGYRKVIRWERAE